MIQCTMRNDAFPSYFIWFCVSLFLVRSFFQDNSVYLGYGEWCTVFSDSSSVQHVWYVDLAIISSLRVVPFRFGDAYMYG